MLRARTLSVVLDYRLGKKLDGWWDKVVRGFRERGSAPEAKKAGPAERKKKPPDRKAKWASVGGLVADFGWVVEGPYSRAASLLREGQSHRTQQTPSGGGRNQSAAANPAGWPAPNLACRGAS